MKYLMNLIAILIVALLILGVVKFKETATYRSFKKKTKKVTSYLDKFIETEKQNITIESTSQRRPPVTFIDRQAKLEVFVPDFFGKLSDKEWRDFWMVIYEPIKEKQGPFKTRRYRTKAEMEEYFLERYGFPFSSFDSGSWNYFWEIVLK